MKGKITIIIVVVVVRMVLRCTEWTWWVWVYAGCAYFFYHFYYISLAFASSSSDKWNWNHQLFGALCLRQWQILCFHCLATTRIWQQNNIRRRRRRVKKHAMAKVFKKYIKYGCMKKGCLRRMKKKTVSFRLWCVFSFDWWYKDKYEPFNRNFFHHL